MEILIISGFLAAAFLMGAVIWTAYQMWLTERLMRLLAEKTHWDEFDVICVYPLGYSGLSVKPVLAIRSPHEPTSVDAVARRLQLALNHNVPVVELLQASRYIKMLCSDDQDCGISHAHPGRKHVWAMRVVSATIAPAAQTDLLEPLIA